MNIKSDKEIIFDEYTFNYDMNDAEINYKYYHSYRVMDAMELLATKLNLSDKDIELAKVIGLFHDIGRFEQDKRYNSFSDIKMDHGNYGVEVLKENKILDKLNIDSSDYEVIYKAIKNHNKFAIEPNLNERELLFSKLIRDADKLDILYALGNENIKGILRQDEEQISKSIEDSYFKEVPANTKESNSHNDGLIVIFCYIYDINFKETYQIILENNYYQKIYNRLNRKDIFEKYLEHTNKYIKERID